MEQHCTLDHTSLIVTIMKINNYVGVTELYFTILYRPAKTDHSTTYYGQNKTGESQDFVLTRKIPIS